MNKTIVIAVIISALTSLSFNYTNQRGHTTIAKTTQFQSADDTLILDDLIFSDFFSPNKDGFNDYFIILNVQNWPGNSLKVYNRWGELVYRAEPYLNDWDGTNNQDGAIMDTKCTDGVYFFQFYNGNDRTVAGKITLKR